MPFSFIAGRWQIIFDLLMFLIFNYGINAASRCEFLIFFCLMQTSFFAYCQFNFFNCPCGLVAAAKGLATKQPEDQNGSVTITTSICHEQLQP